MIKYLFILLTLLLSSCASQEERQEEQEKLDQSLVEALRLKPLSQLKLALGDDDLKDRSEIHNYLASSSLGCPPEATEKAQFLLDKGSLPEEKTIEHYILDNFAVSGPLRSSIESACPELATFYLEKLTPGEIAQGSKEFHGQTGDEIMRLSTFPNNPELELETRLKLLNLVPVKMNIMKEVLEMNQALCDKGNSENCEAIRPLSEEAVKTLGEAVILTHSYVCSASRMMGQEKELMDKQLEFGKKTGVASPKTYDAHAMSYQMAEEQLSRFQDTFARLTGSFVNLNDCL